MFYMLSCISLLEILYYCLLQCCDGLFCVFSYHFSFRKVFLLCVALDKVNHNFNLCLTVLCIIDINYLKI